MNNKMQYVKNKITGKILYHGIADLSSMVIGSDHELVIGNLPESFELEKYEETKEGQKALITRQLEELDRKTIRSLREKANGKNGDTYMKKYEDEATILRAKLKELG